MGKHFVSKYQHSHFCQFNLSADTPVFIRNWKHKLKIEIIRCKVLSHMLILVNDKRCRQITEQSRYKYGLDTRKFVRVKIREDLAKAIKMGGTSHFLDKVQG